MDPANEAPQSSPTERKTRRRPARPATDGGGARYSKWSERARAAVVVAAFMTLVTGVLMVDAVYHPSEPVGLLKLVPGATAAVDGFDIDGNPWPDQQVGAQPRSDQPGLALRMAEDFHQWLAAKRGRPLGAGPEFLVYAAASLHLFTALFLVTLVWIGGRRAPRFGFRIALAVTLCWGGGAVFLLAWYREPTLSHGFAALYALPLFFVAIGAFSRRRTQAG